MKSVLFVAALGVLSACQAERQDPVAQNIEDAYDNKADAMDDVARNASTDKMKGALHDQADAIRAEGEARADAIDDANVNLSDAQQNAAAAGR